MSTIGNRLKIIRENKGISQMQVYKDIGIHNKTLSGYERGVSEPDLQTLFLLATYYKVSTDYLLGITDVKNPSTPYKIDGNKIEEDLLQVTEPEFIRYSNSSYNNLKKLINTRKDLSPEQLDAINTLIDEQFDSLDKFIRAMIKSK